MLLELFVPVRQISKNYLVVTKRHVSGHSESTVKFEPMLEKDYMLSLDTEPAIAGYESSPCAYRCPVVVPMCHICW